MLKTRRSIELEPELRQLDRDVRIEPPPGDLLKQVEVCAHGLPRLIDFLDMFAEDVERSPETFCIQARGCGQRLAGGFSGNVAAGDLFHHGLGNERQRAGNRSIEQRHKGILGA